MGITMLKNLIDPEVMADMVSATLPKKIKFSPIARIDTTLEGQPGSTIKVPKYAYIGDAEDVAEGVAIGTTVLTASSTDVKVKKAGKAVEITDESILSGYGDPMGQATNQLSMSIAAKVDNDCYDALVEAPLVYDGTSSAISYNGIVDANSKFEDEADGALAKLLFIHPLQEATIRKDSNFMDKNKYPLDVVMNGTIGSIAGAQVVKSKKVKKIDFEIKASATSGYSKVVESGASSGEINISDESIAGLLGYAEATTGDDAKPAEIREAKVGDYVKVITGGAYICPLVVVDAQDPNEDSSADGVANSETALTIYMKRGVLIETDRDILKKTNVASADEHYVAVLSNESKVVVAKFKA